MKPSESFVGQPIRSLQTMLRTIAGQNGQSPTVVPDGVYGPATRNAVLDFQKNYGLPATGITDKVTWNAIVDAHDDALIFVDKAYPIEIILEPNHVFVLGDTNPYLFLIQSMLLYLSTLHHAIPAPSHTGLLDQDTAESLRQFQLLSSLPITGELDKKTLMHLSKQFTLNANRNQKRY